MIDFKPITMADQAPYMEKLLACDERGCEFSFVNLYLWGRQKLAFVHDHALLFSQFNRRTVYPFPVGSGDKKAAIDAIIEDSQKRGIPCRITGLTDENIHLLQQLYPDRFRYHCDRDAFDYVYAIEDLADLPGRKYQKKRNHFNRFRNLYPHYSVEPLTAQNLPQVQAMADAWYKAKEAADPESDYLMERAALNRAFSHYAQLGMEALVLKDGEQVLAFTMASPLTENTLDVHFEKALPGAEEAYPVINCEFARFIRKKLPHIRYLNREEDMGIEGLRKAKESYYPHHMTEKCWACLLEDGYDY